jgi:hypothetical protein
MSLINDALKKAQRIRAQEPTGTASPVGEAPRVVKRRQPRTAQQLILLAAGGLVLVVLTMVATVFIFNRTPDPKPAPPTTKPTAPKSGTETSAPSLIIIPPVIKPPATEVPAPSSDVTPPAPTPLPPNPTPPATETAGNPPPGTPPPSDPTSAPPAAATPSTVAGTPAPVPAPGPTPTSSVPPPPAPAPTPAVESPPPSPSPRPAATAPSVAQADPQVQIYIDALKVAGIRSSGGDSRVLMNDRVYRLNDIVDRNLGIRLTKVEPDALTFTDAKGFIYLKTF